MFLHTCLFVFFAEMADKTQLMMMALTQRYRLRHVILGMILGVLIITGLSTLAGDLIGDVIPMRYIKCMAAIMFLGFGLLNLRTSKEETQHSLSLKIPIISIAITFLTAELGDKTQLATVALAADHMQEHLSVFLGASAGLIFANLFGIFAGRILFSHIHEDTMKIASSFFFFLFGSITLFEAIPAAPFIYVIYSFVLISAAYCIFMHSKKAYRC